MKVTVHALTALLFTVGFVPAQGPPDPNGTTFDSSTGRGQSPARAIQAALNWTPTRYAAGFGNLTFAADSSKRTRCTVRVVSGGKTYDVVRNYLAIYRAPVNAIVGPGGATFLSVNGPPTLTGRDPSVGDVYPSPDGGGGTETVLTVELTGAGWRVHVVDPGKAAGCVWDRFGN